uniref:Transmembrane protein n=1 Tax=Rhabditophanes sp. KR3021 TaxID=114890 RepID=A0AC35TJH4_9BILA
MANSSLHSIYVVTFLLTFGLAIVSATTVSPPNISFIPICLKKDQQSNKKAKTHHTGNGANIEEQEEDSSPSASSSSAA